MRILATPLGILLGWLYNLVGSYGLAVVIFTLIVKFAMYPLYASQIKMTSSMSDIQPKIQAIQNKYKDDQELMNQKLQALYEEENYNPTKGCLPMFIQMFILFGLFALLRNPVYYMNSSDMILAVHESFLWIQDLSQPDLWVLPFAAGISTFISFSMTSNPETAGSSGASMKVMKYIFPAMIIMMGRTFPAGLTIYWFLNTVTQILFNLRFKKIREKMKLEKELGKKK